MPSAARTEGRDEGRQVALTTEVEASAQPSRSLRLLKHTGAGLVCSLITIAVLYAVTHVFLPNRTWDWFGVGCTVLVGVGLLGAVGAIVWSVVAWLRRRPTRFSLAASFGVLALVAAILVIVMLAQPADRPSDAQIWAGYRTTHNGITQVAATWRQPRGWPSDGHRNAVAIWVGLDYPEGKALEQIGTKVCCARRTGTVYSAWYELYPATMVAVRLPIRPGDLVSAEVLRLDQGRFRLTLANQTIGRSFSTVQVVHGVGNTHGAIVVEEPDRRDIDLAAFDPVRFSRCAFDGSRIDDFKLTTFSIQADDGSAETVVSPVARGGTSFTVSRW